MWYMVLYILGQGSSTAIIPEKYPTEEACSQAAKPWDDQFRCIKAPDVKSPNICSPIDGGKMLICHN